MRRGGSTPRSAAVVHRRGPAARAARKRSDFLYYGLRNTKLVFGLTLEILLVLAAIIGPVIAAAAAHHRLLRCEHPSARTGWAPTSSAMTCSPSSPTACGRATWSARSARRAPRLVGMALGFIAGWRGGWLDEVLQLVTNIMVMIPASCCWS